MSRRERKVILHGMSFKVGIREPRPEPVHFAGWLQGERYLYDPGTDESVRVGTRRTVVVEKIASYNEDVVIPEPVAGPIYRKAQPGGYTAHCVGCGFFSKLYKRRGEPMLRAWARDHRCGCPSKWEAEDAMRARDARAHGRRFGR